MRFHFVDGHVIECNTYPEFLRKMRNTSFAYRVDQNDWEYMEDCAERAQSRNKMVRSDTIEHFVQDLIDEGVVVLENVSWN